MRGLVIAAALLVVAVPLAFTAPVANAFTYCTSPAVLTPECRDHVACIGGGNYGKWNERCQYGVPKDLCDLITCGPGPVLP